MESRVGIGAGRAVAALERDDADVVIALQLAHADGALVGGAEVQREAQHLELAERVEMGAVARHHLAEHVLGHQRRAAHVVDAQLACTRARDRGCTGAR